MPSAIGAPSGSSAGAMQIIGPVPMVQRVQAESEIAAGKLADQLADKSAAPVPPPQDGRGAVVDTFA